MKKFIFILILFITSCYQPGEWVTLAARATTGTPSFVTGSLNTREDQ